jgi:hypothetical protein
MHSNQLSISPISHDCIDIRGITESVCPGNCFAPNEVANIAGRILVSPDLTGAALGEIFQVYAIIKDGFCPIGLSAPRMWRGATWSSIAKISRSQL